MGPGEMPIFEAGASAAALLHVGDFLEAGVLTVDATLMVRGWNHWLEAASGWSAAEVVGRSLLSVFPALAGSRAEAALRRALDGETVVLAQRFHEFLLPLPARVDFPGFQHMQQSARIAPIRSGEQVVGAVAIIQDVTERVAREAELREAMERAETASEAKSAFMAGLSHELRTPLGAIIGYADLLEGEFEGPLSERQKEHVRRMRAGAVHLTGIIDEILTFSRVEAGREPVHPEPLDASAITRDALALVEPQAGRKRLAMRAELPAAPIAAVTDPGKLRQILVNLLGNAVKFTEAGEVEIRVWTAEERMLFCIRDSGPGIPSEHLERIFEPFTQVEASAASGTGLGLPVSRRLARLLGGDLTVDSTPGQGSRFTLTLPLSMPAVRTGAGR